ncbi:HAD-IC family P-type ATPase [Streptomyces sp. DSM 118878]
MDVRSRGAKGTERAGGHDTVGPFLPGGAGGAGTGRTVRDIVRANVCTRVNAVIGVLLLIVLAVGPVQDTVFGVVVLANILLGVVRDVRAERALDRLTATGGARPAYERIGLGDIIRLGPGDQVVVDGTVLEADGLEVDEALLTGAADPVLKRPGDDVLSGSSVVSGSGALAVERIGRDTRAARPAEKTARCTPVESELRDGVTTLVRYATYAMIPAGIALFMHQLTIGGGDVPEAARRMVAGVLPVVPDGLVLLASVAFAGSVVRLGKRKCLVREPAAVEGLARVDTVCLDKTGTLTEASMDVHEVYRIERDVGVEDVLGALGALGALDAHPTAGPRAAIDVFPAPEGWTEKERAPFSAARRWSGATLTGRDGATVTWLLGAADVLLPAGHSVLVAVDAYGERGLRVLLLARCSLPLSEVLAAPERGPGATDPVALVVIAQRTRKEAPDALRYFAEQGVDVKVISGDDALSAGAVARGSGLPDGDRPVDARRLPDDEGQLAEAMEGTAVFGRVGPRRKRDMVTALRSRGRRVAMTGDGVNDVLALKEADVAICMGTGAPAARSAAQIVLLDNDFSALPSVVAEGRRVIGTIERVAKLFLTKTTYSALLAVIVVLADVPYPFPPRHLTLIGSLTIGIPALFLALAPGTGRPRPHFVRRVLWFAVPCGAVTAAATMGSYAVARAVHGGDLEAQTSATTLTAFLVGLWALSIVARPCTFRRVLLVLAMALSFAAVTLVPHLRSYFDMELTGTTAPCAAAGIAVVAGVLLEGVWRVARHRTATRSSPRP